MYLDIALREHFARPKEDPLLIHGQRSCRDCKRPIPQKRIMANPQAVRCIGCQTTREER